MFLCTKLFKPNMTLFKSTVLALEPGYRSGTVNSNTVNSKFLLNLCQIPIISCLKYTNNSNTVNSK